MKNNKSQAPAYVPSDLTLSSFVTYSQLESSYSTAKESLKNYVTTEIKASGLPIAKALDVLRKALYKQVNPVSGKHFTPQRVSELFLSLDLRSRAKKKTSKSKEDKAEFFGPIIAALHNLAQKEAGEEWQVALRRAYLSAVAKGAVVAPSVEDEE